MAITERTRRFLWFAGLWAGGVIAVAAFAYGLRFLMRLAGLA
jgi:hypothetical protein